jgi:hypothetical protein
MGCDIHGYIDYLTEGFKGETEKRACDFAKVDINRNYLLFSVLAGVRNYDNLIPLSKPKGLPELVSYTVESDNTIYITENSTDDDDYTTPEQAERWVKNGSSTYYKNHWVTHPDWHSHSWLNLEEMRQLREKYLEVGKNYEWVKEFPVPMEAVIGAMEALSKAGKEPRFIFWFDN